MRSRKFLSLLLAAALVIGLLPALSIGAFALDNPVAEIVNGKQYVDLKAALDAAKAGDTVRMLKNVQLEDYGKDGLLIWGNKTLDLNGFVLTACEGHRILYVNSTSSLTITDSNPNAEHYFNGETHEEIAEPTPEQKAAAVDIAYSTDKTDEIVLVKGGMLTGGDASKVDWWREESRGGAIFVNRGELNLLGGTIAWNKAVCGGAVYTMSCEWNDALVVIDGAGIVANEATREGGAIYSNINDIGNNTLCAIQMKSGLIANNTAVTAAGVRLYRGSFTMTGGEITRNVATKMAAGFGYGDGNGEQHGENNCEITKIDGFAPDNLRLHGQLVVGGTAKIYGNYVKGENDTASNVYVLTVANAPKIQVQEDFVGKVGVTVQNAAADAVISYENEGDYAKRFFSDNADYVIEKDTDSGCLELVETPVCSGAVASAVAEGECLTLKLGGKNAGVYDITKKNGKFILRDADTSKYVVLNTAARKVTYSDNAADATAWQYNKGLYVTVSSNRTPRYGFFRVNQPTQYYLTVGADGELQVSLIFNAAEVVQNTKVDGHKACFLLKADGTAKAVCQYCEFEMEDTAPVKMFMARRNLILGQSYAFKFVAAQGTKIEVNTGYNWVNGGEFVLLYKPAAMYLRLTNGDSVSTWKLTATAEGYRMTEITITR